MRIVNLDQRSPEWLAWRNAGLGSSDAAGIVGLSPWTTPRQLWAQKSAWFHKKPDAPPDKLDSGAMARGRRLEPRVATLYSSLMGWPSFPVCISSREHTFLKASLDGWAPRDGIALRMYAAGDYAVLQDYLAAGKRKDLALEIKCPNRDDHDAALHDEVPDKYVPQCYHLLLVSGCPQLHYVSFNDYFPPAKQLAIVSVPAIPEALSSLLAAEEEFWDCVVKNRAPE